MHNAEGSVSDEKLKRLDQVSGNSAEYSGMYNFTVVSGKCPAEYLRYLQTRSQSTCPVSGPDQVSTSITLHDAGSNHNMTSRGTSAPPPSPGVSLSGGMEISGGVKGQAPKSRQDSFSQEVGTLRNLEPCGHGSKKIKRFDKILAGLVELEGRSEGDLGDIYRSVFPPGCSPGSVVTTRSDLYAISGDLSPLIYEPEESSAPLQDGSAAVFCVISTSEGGLGGLVQVPMITNITYQPGVHVVLGLPWASGKSIMSSVKLVKEEQLLTRQSSSRTSQPFL
ncbi:hypothetical protein Bbelb_014150 [Branchiostoma belcheri]|nr:hypothetical protein Bbelb_014150 [Branchiostoma belcheri]